MVNLPWSDSELPQIYIILITILVFVVLAWVVAMIIGPFVKQRSASRGEGSYQSAEEEYEAVVDCPDCGASIEIHTNVRPVRVECGLCGGQTMVK